MVFGQNKAQADARALLLTKKNPEPIDKARADSQIRTGDLILTNWLLVDFSWFCVSRRNAFKL